jgi:hypothetical protein
MPALATLPVLLLATCVLGAWAQDDIAFTAAPGRAAFIVGDAITIDLDFRHLDGPARTLSLGDSALSALAIRVRFPDGSERRTTCRRHEGWDQHEGTSFRVTDRVTYGLILDEFVVLEAPGTYELAITLADLPGVVASTRVTLVDAGTAALERLSRLALTRDPDTALGTRIDAGRLLARTWRREAVPHLMALMQQWHTHGTDVMELALESILRSDDPEGLRWAWSEAGAGKVAALAVHAGSIRAAMLRWLRERPTATLHGITGQ